MPYRVFLTGSGITADASHYLTQHGCALMTGTPQDQCEDLVRKLSRLRPHALIVRQGRITEAVQAAAPDLKVICKHGVGTDNIDIEAATRRGIPVLYTPGANFESVAEHTLALILSLARGVPVHDRLIRRGSFDKKAYEGLELLGKTLGLVGYGRIGRRVAELVAPLNMAVLVYHPSRENEDLPERVREAQTIDEVICGSDIISLHCPLTDDTRNLINRQSIQRMKPGVYVVNTARGGLINETDLVTALQQGHVRGAALDVFEHEPLVQDSPLIGLDNVILTPHVAGTSDSSAVNMGLESAKHVLAVLGGGQIDPSAVKNPEVLSTGVGRNPAS